MLICMGVPCDNSLFLGCIHAIPYFHVWNHGNLARKSIPIVAHPCVCKGGIRRMDSLLSLLWRGPGLGSELDPWKRQGYRSGQ